MLASLINDNLMSLTGFLAQTADPDGFWNWIPGSFWDSEMFQKQKWESFTRFMRLSLTFGAAALLLYELRARKIGTPIPVKTMRVMAGIFIVLSFGVYFDYGNPKTRYSEYYHRHEFFHYYLGSKYFEEVRYSRLYECTIAAEMENGHRAEVMKREMRDLAGENLIKPVPDVISDPEQCKKHFRDSGGELKEQRWAAFKKDVAWFRKSAWGGDYWKSMVKDHGYNPSPVWTMNGKIFGSLAPEASDDAFKTLSGIDILFHIGIVALLWWAFGWRVCMVATVFWGCNAPANFYWTGGAFLRQDWIFFIVASICLVRKRKFALGGAALMVAGGVRLFPLGLFFGYGIVCLMHWISRLKKGGFAHLKASSTFHDQLKLIGGAAAMGVFLFAVSSFISEGANAWSEFLHHINKHKSTPLTNHMGLETILAHDWDGRMRFTRDNALDDPFQGWKQGRLDRAAATAWARYLIVGIQTVWAAWALRRTKLMWIGMPLGCVVVMSLTNMTCYYMSIFIMGAVLIRLNPAIGPMMLITSGFSQSVLYAYYFVDDEYNAMSWLFFTMGMLFYFGISRPFSVERLRAWWNGEPEPKPKKQPPGYAAAS